MTTITNFISFQNVGVRQFEPQRIQNDLLRESTAPVGIKTPLSYGNESEGIFAMNYDYGDQVQDNLKNLILTNHGDRLMRYDYGADLQSLVTEFSTKQDFDSEAMIRINTAVAKNMPYIQLSGFFSRPIFENNEYTGKITVAVKYSVPALNVTDKVLEVTLFVI